MPSTSSSSSTTTTNDPFAKAAASTTTSSSSSVAVPVGEPLVTFHRLPARFPSSTESASIYQREPPAHHVATNGTVTGFRNPWPSFVDAAPKGPAQAIHARFLSRERRYVPIPSAKEELVQVVRPDWGWGCCGGPPPLPSGSVKGGDGMGEGGQGEWGGGGGGGGAAQKEMGIADDQGKAAGKDGEGSSNPNATKMKATWIGHASWLVETGVKRRAPIATPSITLTTDDAGGKVTTTTLDLGGDSDSDDDSDDSSSMSSSGGPDDKTDHEKAAGGGATADDKTKNKKEKKRAEKEKKKKVPHVERGIRILCDPVFSSRMSPVRFAGPKRFTPPPCTLADLPDPVDVVIISHDHYDHLDAPTIRFLVDRERKRQHTMKIGRGILFLCGLGVGRHLQGMGVREEEIVELDWWEGVRVAVRGVKGAARVIATPSQHFSGRGVWDAGKALWCSWVVEEIGIDDDDDKQQQAKVQALPTKANESDAARSSPPLRNNKRLYFAGDTGYRSVPPGLDKDPDAIAELPRCPAFAEIGELYGPFDLSLLPIGCYSPRIFLSPVHAAPEDSVCMHKDLRSKRSVAMHYGTVRMPLSEQYEDVREPPRLWKECAEKEGLKWGEDVEVCKIGETVLV